MNDPEIHSTQLGVGQVGPSSQWKHSHNYRHHKYTNVVGMDDDVGFGVMRVTRDQQWRPIHLLQPLQNLLLASRSNGASPCHDLHAARYPARRTASSPRQSSALAAQDGAPDRKDYVLFPGAQRAAVAADPVRQPRPPTCCATCGPTS